METGSKARFIEQKDQASGAVPMPRGSRPSMAALTRSAGLGAFKDKVHIERSLWYGTIGCAGLVHPENHIRA